ncbi:hypothetical protein HYV71_03210 [Candidatus Uhrbacteria bacterium]|nr:hypothetical protein [Candidatus Uhrbacteria bacterium]
MAGSYSPTYSSKSNNTTALNLLPDDLFSADIFEYLGLTDLDDDQKKELLSIMLETVQGRVVARILDVFETEKERVQFEQALKDKDVETVDDLLASKDIPGITQLVAEEVVLYKIEVMNLFKQET